MSNYYQVQNVPKRLNNAKSLNDSITQNRLPNPSASSIMSDISLVSLCSETQANEVDENEEILAIDGTYVDEEKSYQMMEGVTLNEKFSQDPKKYFEEKLMTAIFRKVWHKVSEKLDIVANLHSGKFPKNLVVKNRKKITENIYEKKITENILRNKSYGKYLAKKKFLNIFTKKKTDKNLRKK